MKNGIITTMNVYIIVSGKNSFVASQIKNGMMLNSKSSGSIIFRVRKEMNLSQADLAQ